MSTVIPLAKIVVTEDEAIAAKWFELTLEAMDTTPNRRPRMLREVFERLVDICACYNTFPLVFKPEHSIE